MKEVELKMAKAKMEKTNDVAASDNEVRSN
jgi:hypothetical protein